VEYCDLYMQVVERAQAATNGATVSKRPSSSSKERAMSPEQIPAD